MNNIFAASRMLFVLLVLTPFSMTGDVHVSPGSGFVPGGTYLTIPVRIENAADLYAYQFDISFDPRIVQLVSIQEVPFLSAVGSSVFIPGLIDNLLGTAEFTIGSLVGNISGASGNGSLANFVFQASGVGITPLTISNLTLLDSNLNDIPFTTSAGSITSQTPEPVFNQWSAIVLAGILVACKKRNGYSRPLIRR